MERLRWLALIAALGVVLAACGGGGGFDLPELTPFDPEVAARLHEIRAKVSEVRGLPSYEKVAEGGVTREALIQYAKEQMAEMSDQEKAEMEAYTAALRLLRMIGPEDDLRELLTEGYVGDILGMYLPKEDQLVLIGDGGKLSIGDELTLAHEYVHSFQDGGFGFETLKEWGESKTDREGYTQYGETIDCLLEGDAEVTERLYAEQTFGRDWMQKVAAEWSQVADESPPLPEFLARAFLFNYRECEQFVQQLYDEGGWDGVNRAYKEPPATTEQVLHPEKYKSGELANGQEPRDLSEQLGEGWKLLDTSQFGEFDVYNYAVTMTGDDGAARIAGAGWGGGWLSVYRSEEEARRVVVQLSLTWDSNRDMEEFLLVYAAILDLRGVEWQEQVDQPEVRWTAEGEHGVVRWDERMARVDILIATDGKALEQAA